MRALALKKQKKEQKMKSVGGVGFADFSKSGHNPKKVGKEL